MTIKKSHLIRFLKDNYVILLISLVNFFIIYIPNLFGYYSYFIDEFYFIACSKRLAFGYVDNPPFAIFLLSIIRLLLGDSILALRLLPALASASLTFLIGIITKRLGGNKFAQGLASFAVSIVPFYLIMNSIYSMHAFQPLLLTCCVLILIIIIQDKEPRYWLLLGLIIGIGLINQHTFVVFGFAILIGIIFTPLRKYFGNKFFWLGILITIIIVLPNIIWEIQNNFISVEYAKFIATHNATTLPFMFVMIQIIAINPLVFPICLLGIIFLFFKTEGKPYRVFGWMFLIPFVFFLLMKTNRPDRVAPVYPILIASGSIMIELWINKINKDWLKSTIVSILIIGGIFSFSLSLPILPPKALFGYGKTIGLRNQEYGKRGIPITPVYNIIYKQLCAYRLGWESMVADVATVYDRLPDKDKKKAVIFAGNNGEAGAIEFFRSKYNLPMVISGHLNYWLWGYGKATGDLMISIGVGKDILNAIFEKVEESGVIHTCDYCLYYENNLPIYICRKIKFPIKEIWQRISPNVPLTDK